MGVKGVAFPAAHTARGATTAAAPSSRMRRGGVQKGGAYQRPKQLRMAVLAYTSSLEPSTLGPMKCQIWHVLLGHPAQAHPWSEPEFFSSICRKGGADRKQSR